MPFPPQLKQDIVHVVVGPSGVQAQSVEDGPSAPDLQLDWLSSSSDSDDTDDDSGIEVVSVQYKQSAQRVSYVSIGCGLHMGDMRNACEIFVRKPEGRECLGHPCINGMIILK
jgi:hypothetical protein